jgi:hypothetical protein
MPGASVPLIRRCSVRNSARRGLRLAASSALAASTTAPSAPAIGTLASSSPHKRRIYWRSEGTALATLCAWPAGALTRGRGISPRGRAGSFVENKAEFRGMARSRRRIQDFDWKKT